MRNSFKELEKENIERFKKESDNVKQKIEGETSSYKFIGDVLDLYFSKVMGVFVAMSGGGERKTEDDPKKDDINPAD